MRDLLEDAGFYRKLRKLGRVRQLPLKIQTSARRYEALGPICTSLFYLLIMTLYFVPREARNPREDGQLVWGEKGD